MKSIYDHSGLYHLYSRLAPAFRALPYRSSMHGFYRWRSYARGQRLKGHAKEILLKLSFQNLSNITLDLQWFCVKKEQDSSSCTENLQETAHLSRFCCRGVWLHRGDPFEGNEVLGMAAWLFELLNMLIRIGEAWAWVLHPL